MLSAIWDATIPTDTSLAGDGDDEMRNLKVELKEHLEQDHQMTGVLDPLSGNCDGYHIKATFSPLASDPTVPTGTGIVYTKIVDGVQELFFKDSVTNIVNQLTENGFIKMNTLQNDIDGNDKKILNLTELEATKIVGTVVDHNTDIVSSSGTVSYNANVKYPCVVTAGNKSVSLSPGLYVFSFTTYYTPPSGEYGMGVYGNTLRVLKNGCEMSSSSVENWMSYQTQYIKLRESFMYGGSTVSDVIAVS
jgi:hypothetical protein